MRDLAGLDVCLLAGTLGQGGAERQLFYILQALCRSGAKPRLLSLTQGEFWESHIRELGVPVTWVGQHPSRARRVWEIVRALRAQRPSVLQSQHFYTNLYVVAAARLLGIPEIGAIRSNGLSELQEAGRLAGYCGMRLPRTLAANSESGIRNVISLGVPASRLRLLPNVVDTERFQPGPPREDGTVRLLAVGRLGPEKRFDRFLELLAALRGSGSRPVTGVIAGDGTLRDELEAQAQRLGLAPPACEFRGAVASTAELYREADVLVLTSDWEGTPNVVLEAMASALPVVATRVGGVAELVTDGETGFLVEPEDASGAEAAVRRLVEDPALRRSMGASGRARILARHSPERLPAFLEELYRTVIL
jgi:glycosyltransferase involved in cell wall biosynthesis